LIRFLRVSPYNNPTAFNRTFIDPIQKERPQGWARLNQLVKAVAIRRTKGTEGLNLELPPREEIIQYVPLDAEEQACYDHILRAVPHRLNPSLSRYSPFLTILRLRQVSNHRSLLPEALQDWLVKAIRSADVLPLDILAIRTCEFCFGNIPENFEKILPCSHSICSGCLVKGEGKDRENCRGCPTCSANVVVAPQRRTMSRGSDSKPSSKTRALLENLGRARRDSIDKPIKRYIC
jgi:SNF2 family DNA or RNA helicase